MTPDMVRLGISSVPSVHHHNTKSVAGSIFSAYMRALILFHKREPQLQKDDEVVVGRCAELYNIRREWEPNDVSHEHNSGSRDLPSQTHRHGDVHSKDYTLKLPEAYPESLLSSEPFRP